MLVSKSQVKYIQSLSHKKFRDEAGVFLAEGPKIVDELLHLQGLRCRQVFAVQEWVAGYRGGAVPVQEVGEEDLKRLSALATPNRVVAVFEKPGFSPPDFNTGITLVLDGIQDPGNLGTLVRVADWFGLTAVVCSSDSADVFNAKAIQSTMGSVGRVPVLYADPETLVSGYSGMPVYATVLGGKDLYSMGRVDRGFIVIGNESGGIRAGLLALATDKVTIPGAGRAESLNAAVAGGIVVSHLVSRLC
ncbi:MAG TPA: RNA methyltransferase [Puia sp.]|jgi:TrmH family RNA methyltransferase|nr:RNA methyltransferase [Puia sp.]